MKIQQFDWWKEEVFLSTAEGTKKEMEEKIQQELEKVLEDEYYIVDDYEFIFS